MKDYYSILKIDPTATADQIRRAYRRLALKNHPDRPGVENTDQFMRIKEARDTLSDPEKKQAYDRQRLTCAGEVKTVSVGPAQHDLSFVKMFIKKMPGARNPIKASMVRVTGKKGPAF